MPPSAPAIAGVLVSTFSAAVRAIAAKSKLGAAVGVVEGV